MFFTRFHDDRTLTEKLRIEDAQPRETMTDELMRDLSLSPWARLDGDACLWIFGSIETHLSGRVLTIWDDYGHRYIYRVVGYDFQRCLYELEWPD